MNMLESEYESMIVSFCLDGPQACITRHEWLARNQPSPKKALLAPNLSTCQSGFGEVWWRLLFCCLFSHFSTQKRQFSNPLLQITNSLIYLYSSDES